MRGCVNVRACARAQRARVRAHRCIDVRAMRYRDREGARWEEQEEEDVDGAMRRGVGGGEHRERESWSDGEGSIRPGQSVTMSLV